MKKKLLLLSTSLLALFYYLPSQVQDLSMSFDWTTRDTLKDTSATMNTICQSHALTTTLITTEPHHLNSYGNGLPLSLGEPTTSVLIPYPTSPGALNQGITINFSEFVKNVRILIRDLDNDNQSNLVEEYLDNFKVNGLAASPPIPTTVSGALAIQSGQIIPQADNSSGWLTFPSNGITTISFDYVRLTDEYSILLDSIALECDSGFVAVEHVISQMTFKIYPNPATTTLRVLGIEDGAAVAVMVADVSGRTLLQSDSPEIDVQSLASGMYFLSLTSKEDSKVLRFVKQ